MLRLLLVWVVCLLHVLPAWAQPVETGSLRRLNQAFVELAAKLTPAVVLVTSDAYQPITDEGVEPRAFALRPAAGSGVILSEDGYIVTNAHVVAGATRVHVQLSSYDAPPGRSIVRPRGRMLSARIVGVDRETDLALLKVGAKDLPQLTLADSDKVAQGQIVMALGNPLGLDSSLSMGIISAVARQLRPDDRVIYLQTDAPINPGSSGGPLVDIEGNVIGINTLILSQSGGNQGLGFALPSNIVRSVTDQLREHGVFRRGDIGVEAQTITPALAAGWGLPRDRGVVLADVTPHGPADNAGLQIGDVILTLNGKPMENARQFHVDVYQRRVASTVTLDILRDSEKMVKTVVVLDRQDGPERFSSLVNERQNFVERLGILGIGIDPKITELLEAPLRRPYGILVARLAATAQGATGLLLPGDVIYALNKQPVSTLHELNTLLEKHKDGGVVVLQLERKGVIRFVEVPLE